MSYEGYTQHICELGHYFENDAYDEPERCWCCANLIWRNSVDTTNDDGSQYRKEPVLVKAAVTHKCSSCGMIHLKEHALFRPPDEKAYPGEKCPECGEPYDEDRMCPEWRRVVTEAFHD